VLYMMDTLSNDVSSRFVELEGNIEASIISVF
jgi:hypothetical protein